MYLLGIVVALLMAWVFKKTLLKGETPMLIMELPPYKMPVLKVILRHMWDRGKLFLRRAGTVILGINILLWFLATYPKNGSVESEYETQRVEVSRQVEAMKTAVEPTSVSTNELAALEGRLVELDAAEAGAKLRYSFAGRLGHLIEPVIAPLGFDWKMGIGIVASFAAREVFVSTMATVYNVGQAGDDDENMRTLAQTLQAQERPDGSPVYTTLTGLTLMVFYVFALQCVSTVAVVRRETNSWKWPFIQWAYMAVLAWGLAWLTKLIGHACGLS
jgi:ferrous iron transport protein B